MTDEKINSASIHRTLAIIGAGMAGISAAVFALNRNISTVLVGRPSGTEFSSGCLDLFSVLPSRTPAVFSNPFRGIDALAVSNPAHPYARTATASIRNGFDEFISFMSAAGLIYHRSADENRSIITPAGTLKPTFCIPEFMMAGAAAAARRDHILLVDIQGLKGFSARQMAGNLTQFLPGIRYASITFPGRETEEELMCERLAWDLDRPGILERLGQAISAHTAGMDAVGLPAVLGIWRFNELRGRLEQMIGKPVFEIPALAPSVCGMRISAAFTNGLSETGITHFQTRVKKIDMDRQNRFSFPVLQGIQEVTVTADYLLLATGRFMSQGLEAGNDIIREPLIGLPVHQPHGRSGWFSRDFFDPAGHPVNRAGIETDPWFRPLDTDGNVYHPNLFAAGSILAHQDWKRERSGAGISISTAMESIETIQRQLYRKRLQNGPVSDGVGRVEPAPAEICSPGPYPFPRNLKLALTTDQMSEIR